MSAPKVVRVGTIAAGYPARACDIFAKIEHTSGRLTISGVIGPKRNGDAEGSAGQIVMSFKEYDERGHHTLAEIEPAPGWDAEKVRAFFDVWDRWHLNDMRAGCEHQRDIDTRRKVEVVTYRLNGAELVEQNKLQRAAMERLLAGEAVKLDESTRRFLALPFETTQAPDADSEASGRYRIEKREHKAIGWLRPDEHPEGMLGRPCDVCGYKYGTRWQREEVPAEVLAFLAALPDADKTPAWV